MTPYKISDITNVYWAANDGFKVGRDPMGIQNSSIATYGRLLPGMTNLTGHIRYYSLYCWLLYEYGRLRQNENENLPLYNYIRRAELIMAFIMKNKGVKAVVGANFVSGDENGKSVQICHDDIYYINEGADYESKNKYWAYSSGAFGQYYVASLIHFSLVGFEKGKVTLRIRGEKLAHAVINSVSGTVRDTYLDCIKQGRLSKREIKKLQPMGLHSIVKNSEEWTMLNGFLTMPDEDGTTLRRETIYLMLSDFAKGVKLQDFVKHRFRARGNNLVCCQKAAFGWYFYYLCEIFHYCIETIFCCILETIGELHNPPIGELIERTTTDVLACLKDEQLYDDIIEWALECTQPIEQQFASVKDAINEKNYVSAAKKAVVLCLRLYNEVKDNEEEIKEFEVENRLSSQRGILRKGVEEYVERHKSLTPKAYIRAIIRQIMNEHTLVAINKMGNSDVDLRKFILENGRVILVQQREPNQTNPRIESLRNFLVDLGYITDDEKLTDVANQFLNDYGKKRACTV